MTDFLFGAVWSRTFGPVLIAQALAALVAVVFCWRAALAFNRPGPWWWFGAFSLLLAARPVFLLAQEFVPSDARWVRALDVLVMPSLQVGVLAFAIRAVARELVWHRAQARAPSPNVTALKQLVDSPRDATPAAGLTSAEHIARHVEHLTALVTLWANAAGVGFISIGEDSVIKYANPGAHFLFGYKWGTLLGRPLTDLMPPELRARHLQALRRYLDTGQRTFPWQDLHFDALCEDGTTRPITLTFIETFIVGERTFTGLMQERRAA